MGGNAATMGVLDAVRRGATDEQALMIGTLNRAFEVLFEEISIENLWKGDPHSLVNAIFKQGAIEGTEESFTSISNTVADILVMAQDSNHEQKIQGYVSQGMSESEARRQAFLDAVIAVAWDYVGGMLSGGLMGGGKYAGTQVVNWEGNRYNNETNIERDGFYEFGREETAGTQGTHRGVVWRETGGADGGEPAGNQKGPSKLAEAGEYKENPSWSSGTNQAAQIISDFGGEYVVEPDEQIRAHVNGPAYTSNGVIHLSDRIASNKLGVIIGNHERVHQLKQINDIQYRKLLDDMNNRVSLQGQQPDFVLTLLSEARFGVQSFDALNLRQQWTVMDELNALVYGFYKDNAANAKYHFGDVFYDYESHVAELDSIVNAASKSGGAARGTKPSLPPSNSNSEVSPYVDIKQSLSKSQEIQKLTSVAHTPQERLTLDRYKSAVSLLENRQAILLKTQQQLQQLAATGRTGSAEYNKLKSAEITLSRKVDEAQRKVDRFEKSSSIDGLNNKLLEQKANSLYNLGSSQANVAEYKKHAEAHEVMETNSISFTCWINDTEALVDAGRRIIVGERPHAINNRNSKSDRAEMSIERAQTLVDNAKLTLFQEDKMTLKFISDDGYAVLNIDNILVTAVPQKWRRKYNQYLGGTK